MKRRSKTQKYEDSFKPVVDILKLVFTKSVILYCKNNQLPVQCSKNLLKHTKFYVDYNEISPKIAGPDEYCGPVLTIELLYSYHKKKTWIGEHLILFYDFEDGTIYPLEFFNYEDYYESDDNVACGIRQTLDYIKQVILKEYNWNYHLTEVEKLAEQNKVSLDVLR